MIFVCSYNVVKGGGVNISLDFTKYLLEKGYVVILMYPDNSYYTREVNELLKYSNFKPYRFHKFFNLIFFKPIINYIFLPLFVKLTKPDKIYNFGNIAFPTKIPQFLLMHNAYLVVDKKLLRKFGLRDFIYLKLMSFFIRINLSFASIVGVQTKTIQKKILLLNHNLRLILIPNSINLPIVYNLKPSKIDTSIKLLFLSKYYPHKNFEILFKLGEKLKQNNIKIYVTLENKIKCESEFLQKIKLYNLDDVVINIGYISQDKLEDIYLNVDGLFLPSLLESFSTTYIEAFCFKVPVFTSNLDFANEICQGAAFYFNPFDVDDILSTIIYAFSDPMIIAKKIKIGTQILSEFKSQKEIFDNIYSSL